ncbi:SulP family inorganic anion transporter [Trinickia caryophylli]|uniref:Sulfate permease, MFS superfamily n=1 Tax=Trinickia caryophylli TaxID=28094 RepID=A0A1X7GZI2_TRICW|nr:SulP family inorganic anion transporter [Trinickia caryophylli]PMS10092.1 SulP family inorganic anion transporter [Trinickia caryophylli]TRX18188.1 SulP family inorganic anion transporter [Trinickia caryophylli]WQE11022.1 SulP family inorganic anion transporter [Trinickia caryophylli]SMF77004.1 Sulfate permease, MFS superfamily [Trinickia caryophylli]GLU35360.1 transport-related membrane protein [Trinickia caryophylli]
MNHAKLAATLPRDCFSGTVVFLVALPLCLGIAQASGVEPFAGLLAGMIGGLVIALLSGSRLSVSGPAAGLIMIVVDGIANVGGFSAFLSALVVGGAMQFLFGVLKAGRFAAYVPSPVIKGMLAAIGLLLIIKQTPVALGLGAAGTPGTMGLETPFGPMAFGASGIALVSLAILFGWESRFVRRLPVVSQVPAPLVVVAFGIAATAAFDAWAPALALPAASRVNLAPLDSLGALAGVLTSPDMSALANLDVWRLAATIAIVASLETLLCLEAIEQMDPQKRSASPDRELKAQGVGNMLAGLLGALPITSVIVRSSANLHAGAQTRWSSFIHGVLLLASVFALSGLLNRIPLACLAAILIATGYKLAKPALFVDTARRGLNAFVPFIATIAGVLATDLLIGIACGLACSIVLALHPNLRHPFSIARHGNEFLLLFRKDVTCFIRAKLKTHLAELPDRATLIVDTSRADFVDPDVRSLIAEFAAQSAHRGISVSWR